MGPRSPAARRAAAVAAGLMITGLTQRVVTLRLPPDRRAVEGGLLALAAIYALLAVRLRRCHWDDRNLAVVLQGVVPSILAAALVLVAGPALPDGHLVLVLLFTVIQLGLPPEARHRAVTVAAALDGAILAAVWLRLPPADPAGLVFALCLIGGIALVLVAQASRAEVTAQAEQLRSSAHAVTAEHVGTAIDLPEVTRAVLQSARQHFPLTTHASVLLWDAAGQVLRPAPVFLSPRGIEALEVEQRDAGAAMGEDLGAAVLAARRALVWPTASAVHLAQAGDRPVAPGGIPAPGGSRLTPLSAVGAPLSLGGETIGVYLLATHRRELAWTDEDVPVVTALAAEAARAIARARRFETELDQAHLDSVTGLLNHRQLGRVLEQEVARARRRDAALGVLFGDLDRFKAVNDRFGHAAGDRVLTILARVLHDSLRGEDTAARYGGDEFVCVLPGADLLEARAVAERIAGSCEACVEHDADLTAAGVTMSWGMAIFPEDGAEGTALLEHADSVMREVKERRRPALPGAARI